MELIPACQWCVFLKNERRLFHKNPKNDFIKIINKKILLNVQLAGIAVQGNTAVVHYYFTNERKDAEGKIKKDSGRLIDILIKENSKWKYLA